MIEGHINKGSEPDDEDERLADKYAQDVLIPPEEYIRFTGKKDYVYSKVREFALSIGIDAGIVVGRLQNDGELGFDQLNGLRKHMD